MSCCGKKRESWREWNAGASRQINKVQQKPELQNPTKLCHLGETSLVIKGAVTNFTYLFGGRDTSLDVDERDIPGFMEMQRFAMSIPDQATKSILPITGNSGTMISITV
jgi:hypothetical protein